MANCGESKFSLTSPPDFRALTPEFDVNRQILGIFALARMEKTLRSCTTSALHARIVASDSQVIDSAALLGYRSVYMVSSDDSVRNHHQWPGRSIQCDEDPIQKANCPILLSEPFNHGLKMRKPNHLS